jgi:HTH-type transcriptional regulator/antitoxin HigA
MAKITKEQYEFALARIEELLPMVDDNTPANDRNAVELTLMSDVVIDYEKEHYPIDKPTVAQLKFISPVTKSESTTTLKILTPYNEKILPNIDAR